jgi:hypothetical protein
MGRNARSPLRAQIDDDHSSDSSSPSPPPPASEVFVSLTDIANLLKPAVALNIMRFSHKPCSNNRW